MPFRKFEQDVVEDIFKAGYKTVELEKKVYKHIGYERSTHESMAHEIHTRHDPSLQLQPLARERISQVGLPVDLIGLSAEKIPLPDASFDTVLITYTLCTIPDPRAALREMRRVLTPAGKLLFCEHGRAPDASVQRWQDRLQPVWGPLAGGCHLGRDIPALLTEAGFTLTNPQTRYLPGPRPFTFHYWGEAIPRSPDAVPLS